MQWSTLWLNTIQNNYGIAPSGEAFLAIWGASFMFMLILKWSNVDLGIVMPADLLVSNPFGLLLTPHPPNPSRKLSRFDLIWNESFLAYISASFLLIPFFSYCPIIWHIVTELHSMYCSKLLGRQFSAPDCNDNDCDARKCQQSASSQPENGTTAPEETWWPKENIVPFPRNTATCCIW